MCKGQFHSRRVILFLPWVRCVKANAAYKQEAGLGCWNVQVFCQTCRPAKCYSLDCWLYNKYNRHPNEVKPSSWPQKLRLCSSAVLTVQATPVMSYSSLALWAALLLTVLLYDLTSPKTIIQMWRRPLSSSQEQHSFGAQPCSRLVWNNAFKITWNNV